MRIWFDTEFIEDGKTTDLVSIGMVREDGATYYAECAEADLSRADDWVRENVIAHLTGEKKPRAQIAQEILEFAGENPEFWAYYADYDWVALCQLYGRMIDLPKGWPMFCRDLKQWCVDLGNPSLPEQKSTEHHALADAHWNSDAWRFLAALAQAPGVKVKELEWQYSREDEDAFESWSAASVFGSYVVIDYESHISWIGPFAKARDLPSVEEAKAAAQANYEARIRSALAAAPNPEGE